MHLHIEGTFEPELLFKIAERNGLRSTLPYSSVKECRDARNFKDLQSFLDMYYAACAVLKTEADFTELALEYLKRAAEHNGVRYVEMFWDYQTHGANGISFDTVIGGLHRAVQIARERHGIEAQLILCFLRHLSQDEALLTLTDAIRHKDKILGIGLDSGEAGNPPEKFTLAYEMAKAAGFRLVAHAGEEGPASNITGAIDKLGVERVDHGVRCLEDDAVVARLSKERVPLTVCPQSNWRLQVYPRYFGGVNCCRQLIDRGVMITLNSDDPAYFAAGSCDGYLAHNFIRTAMECHLTRDELVELAVNSFDASFLDAASKARHIKAVREYAARSEATW